MWSRNKYLFCILIVLLVIGRTATTAEQESNAEHVVVSSSKCFLVGSVRKRGDTSSSSFRSLANQIRLNFDANDLKTCKRYISSYCRNNILDRGDEPVKLGGYFRPPASKQQIEKNEEVKPSAQFEVTETCKVIVIET